MKLHIFKSSVVFILLLITADLLAHTTPLAYTTQPSHTVYVGWKIDNIEFNFKTTKSIDKAALLEIMFISKTLDFNQDELEKDRQRIKKFYFDNGFFDAIIDTNVTYDNVDNAVDIEIIIIENSHYTIKEIVIKGLANIAPNLKENVASDRLVKPDDFYVKANVSKETNRIIDVLQNNGYLNAGVDTSERTEIAKYSAEVQKNPEFKNKVRVTITFTGVNKIYYFGKTDISIVDNKYKLEKSIVQRELKYSEGEVYSKDKLVESERNLTRLALIQLGRIQIDTVDEQTGRVHLIVNITLNKKYQVTPSIVGKFIENYFYLGAGLQYDDKNFFGGGRVLSVKFEPLFHNKDINEIGVSASLFQPYLFRDNVTANYTISLLHKNYNEFRQFLTLSNTLTLNYYLRKYVFYNYLSAQLNVDLLREKAKQTYINDESNLVPIGTITNTMNSVLGFTATHNSANNVFNPSGGFFHSFTLEEAGLIPSMLNKVSKNIDYAQYYKFYMANFFYFDVSSGLARRVVAIGNKIGDIEEFGNNPNITPILPLYKFFSGGGNSVRGWDAQKNGILQNTSDGGKFLFEGSVEYRWMMFGDKTNFLKDFGSVFFLDYGNVWVSHTDFHLNQIALAVGFGFRYYTFVGPIRVDFGIRLYDPKEEVGKKWIFKNLKGIFSGKSTIQFGLGNAF